MEGQQRHRKDEQSRFHKIPITILVVILLFVYGYDLTEAEDIRRGGKNTQKNCTKKIFMTQIITMM